MDATVSTFFIPAGRYCNWFQRMAPETAVWVCGYAYHGAHCYSGEALAQMVIGKVNDQWDTELPGFLKSLNGNWAFVVLAGKVVYVMSDRMRSFPLLYSELSGRLLISDDIRKVCGGHTVWCADGVEDFLWAGYPTGMSTLVDGVSQVPAGMYLRYDTVTKQKTLTEYHSFLPTGDELGHQDVLSRRLSELLEEAIARVRGVIRGRIVVPLSGGMDSRVIAALLRKNGFEDVLCFSYGRKHNAESDASRKVAEALGYEWEFVEYSPEMWASCMFSQEMKDYLVFASNACSMPEYLSWCAVKSLRESGKVSAGDTFLPGHAGDFLAGSHIPRDYFVDDGVVDLYNIVDHIIRKHFSLWPGPLPETMRSRLFEGLLLIRGDIGFSNVEAAGVYERWDWRERQAKMIVNIDRVYEYFGCGWLVPLWDSALTDFYLKVPFRLRRNRTLFYHSAVTHVFSGKLAPLADIPLAVPGRLSPRRMLKFTQEAHSWQTSRRTVLKGKVKEFLSATRPGRTALQVKRRLWSNRKVKYLDHGLLFSHSFSDGPDPRQHTVRQVFDKHGLSHLLGRAECGSVSGFLDLPVGYIDPYGISSLYGLVQMETLTDGNRQ